MVISTRVTLDLRLAHTPGGVIRLLPSQTGARGCHLVGDIALAGVACPLRVGSYPPLASGSSISCLRGNQRLDGGRSKQLPYSGLNRWWRWQEINTVSFLHFTNIISIWAKNRFNTFSNIRSKKKKKRALLWLCHVLLLVVWFIFLFITYSFRNIWNNTLHATPQQFAHTQQSEKMFWYFLEILNTAAAFSSNDNGECAVADTGPVLLSHVRFVMNVYAANVKAGNIHRMMQHFLS